MFQSLGRKKYSLLFRIGAFFVILAFSTNLIIPPTKAHAQSVLNLPNPGVMVTPTSGFIPPMLKGMKVDPQQPFQFDFIFDSGNSNIEQSQLKEEAGKLIRYFLASLTIPEDDLWVNLSPYEKDRIIPSEFGETEMGRDLLAQDYILKQLTASLIYPEEDLGKEFWERVYEKANQLYGITQIPINTFNKVWIVPDKAVVYEKNDIAFVLESHLKVMLEEDYIALKHNLTNEGIGTGQLKEQKIKELSSVSSSIIKEVVVPEIEKEVNRGRNFAKLRQVYHSLILAKWYKERLKTSLLNQAYSDQKKINGVDADDKAIKEKIYQQYLKAFKVGVFNYIKEDYDTYSQSIIPRKYFSGGMELKVPLEIETDPSPDQLAKADAVGKLSWIQGIYRQPRSSPRSVNDFIRKQFRKGHVSVGEDIILKNGSSCKTYYVDDLLKAMGQLGHIGFIEKDENGRAIEGGLEVVFLDSKHGKKDVVRRNEALKVLRWVQKRESLGLSPKQMWQWLKEHFNESIAFLQEVDQEADQKYSIESIYAQAEKTGEFPSNDQIASTYTKAEDFQDLNLADGRTALEKRLDTISKFVLQQTNDLIEMISKLMDIVADRNEDGRVRMNAVELMGKLTEKGLIGEAEMEGMVKPLMDIAVDRNEDGRVRMNAVELVGKLTEKGLIGEAEMGGMVNPLMDIVADRNEDGRVRMNAVELMGKLTEKGLIGEAEMGGMVKPLMDIAVDRNEDSDVRTNAIELVGKLTKKGLIGEAVETGGMVKPLMDIVADRSEDGRVRTNAVELMGKLTEKGLIGEAEMGGMVKPLMDIVADRNEDWYMRTNAVELMGKLTEKGLIGEAVATGEMVKPLMDIVADRNEDWYMRTNAIELVGKLTEKGLIGEAVVTGGMVKPLMDIAADRSEDPDVRTNAVELMGKLKEKGLIGEAVEMGGMVKTLMDIVADRSEDPDVRTNAVELMGKFTEKGLIGEAVEMGGMVKPLMDIAADRNEDGRVRTNAVELMGKLKEKGLIGEAVVTGGMVKPLMDIVVDRNKYWRERTNAVELMGKLTEKGLIGEAVVTGGMVKPLMDIAVDRNEDPDVRTNAVELMGKLTEKGLIGEAVATGEMVKPLMDIAVDRNEDGRARMNAVELMGKLTEKGLIGEAVEMGEMVKPLTDIAADRNRYWYVRTNAVELMGKLKEKGLIGEAVEMGGMVKPLMDIVADRNGGPDVRTNAVELMGKLTEKGLIGEAVEMGGMVKPLMDIVADRNEDGRVRMNAVELMGKLTEKGLIGEAVEMGGMVKPLMDIAADRNEDSDVRTNAVELMGKLKEKGLIGEAAATGEMLAYYLLLKEEIVKEEEISKDNESNSKKALILRARLNIKGEVDSEDVKYLGHVIDRTGDVESLRIMFETMRLFSLKGSRTAKKYMNVQITQVKDRKKEAGQGYIELSNKEKVFLEIAVPDLAFSVALKLFANAQLPPAVRLKILRNLSGERYLEYSEDDIEGLESLLESPNARLSILKRIAKMKKEDPDAIELSDVKVLLQENLSELDSEGQRFILHEIIEPLFFLNPGDLTLSILNRIYAIFKEPDIIKYFLFYVSTRDRAPPEVKERARQIISQNKDLFTLHKQVNERLAEGDVEMLVMHNIKDGQGDELIRMHTFIQALLDFNPDLRVTVVTGRTYLYNHPRVTVRSINDDLHDVFSNEYDIIVDHYDTDQRYSDQAEDQLRKSFGLESQNALSKLITDKLKKKKTRFMYIKTNKSNDDFIFETMNVEGVNVEASLGLNRVQVANVYEPVFRLLSELGIPFRVGEENNKQGSLIVGVPYAKARRAWVEMMESIENYDGQRNTIMRPVVLINPFGGEREIKGYSHKQNDIKELRSHMHTLIASGLKIVILPNGKPWGTREVAQEIVQGMEEDDQKSIVIGPEPQKDSRFFKYFVSYADYLVTVEGGMMHLGYMMGKPMGVVLKFGAGPAKWIPYGISENQGIVTGADVAAERYRNMNVRRNQRIIEDKIPKIFQKLGFSDKRYVPDQQLVKRIAPTQGLHILHFGMDAIGVVASEILLGADVTHVTMDETMEGSVRRRIQDNMPDKIDNYTTYIMNANQFSKENGHVPQPFDVVTLINLWGGEGLIGDEDAILRNALLNVAPGGRLITSIEDTGTRVNGYERIVKYLEKIGVKKSLYQSASLDIKLPFRETELIEVVFTEEAVQVIQEKLSSVDSAMLGDVATSSSVQENPGGIDFNPNLLELQIEGEGSDFNLQINNTNLEQIHIEGLLPVIINITPITNLPFILGTTESEMEPLAFSNN